MKEQDSVSIVKWTAKSKKILISVNQLLNKIGYDDGGIPSEVFEGDKPVSLVFAGQYSAGKSSILKALTSINSIAIGAGITTQEAHSYDWNGIEVIDTPGIHTTLRPDHDEISYQAIVNSDMLVYVVTQELFDDFIGQNFRRLLLEKDKAREMILIVNKMADIGNTFENKEIKLKDLEKVTKPYTPAQLRTVFIDAESYLDSISELDYDIAEELRERSNFDALVATLNTFIEEKTFTSRMTTVLYKVQNIVQKALSEYQPSSGDNDIDAFEEHQLQKRNILLNTQWRIETSVKSIIENSASQIREKGREIANSIYGFDNEEDAEEAINDAYNEVNIISNNCIENVTLKITELSKDCLAQLDEFYKSDFSQSLKINLERKYANGNTLIGRLFKTDFLAQGSSKIISNTAGKNVATKGLESFTGSNIHKIVLDIGHFFGHKFKPWEAVKWVKRIGNAGKVLGVFGVIVSVGIQFKEDVDSDKRQIEMKENRVIIRSGFNSAANELVKHFNSALVEFLKKNYIAPISEIDSNILEIRNMRFDKSETCKHLESIHNDCRLLIAEIHQSHSDYGEI